MAYWSRQKKELANWKMGHLGPSGVRSRNKKRIKRNEQSVRDPWDNSNYQSVRNRSSELEEKRRSRKEAPALNDLQV